MRPTVARSVSVQTEGMDKAQWGMHRLRALVVILVCSSFASADDVSPNSRYARDGLIFETYWNAKYGYTIDYPVGLLMPQPSVDAGDGRTFIAPDHGASLVVYGSNLILVNLDSPESVSVQAWYEAELERAVRPSYHLVREAQRWFVISGVDGDEIYYRKSIHAWPECGFVTFELRYPRDQAEAFDPVVERAASTFACFR
jgi:hypothetical protein